MKNNLWALVILATGFLSFFVGWNLSVGTGVEPGFFEAPEAGGYGAGAEAKAPEGVTDEMQQYYQELSESE